MASSDPVWNRSIKLENASTLENETTCDGRKDQCERLQRDKFFWCDMCNKVLHGQDEVNTHNKLHGGENTAKFKVPHGAISHEGGLNYNLTLENLKSQVCDNILTEGQTLENKKGTQVQLKSFKCKECKSTFTHKSSLNRHLKTHSKKNLFECKECHKSFTRRYKLTNHLSEKKCLKLKIPHKNLSMSSVYMCSKISHSQCEINTHNKLHAVENSPEFKMLRETASHKGSPNCNSVSENVKCKTASIFTEGKKIENDEEMNQRKKSMASFKCEECNSTFTSRSSLNRHLKIHSGKKSFKCEKCHKTFTRHYNLTNHLIEKKCLKLKMPHTNLSKSSVYVCSKLSHSQGEINTHDKLHAVENSPAFKMLPETTSDEGSPNYDSVSENVKSKTASTFTEGKKLENDEEMNQRKKSLASFKCEECNSTFTSRSSLNRHLKIHSEKKSFKCEKCHKTFTRHYNLANHLSEKKCLKLKMPHTNLSKSSVYVCSKLPHNQGEINTHNKLHAVENSPAFKMLPETTSEEGSPNYNLASENVKSKTASIFNEDKKLENDEEMNQKKSASSFKCEECNSTFTSQSSFSRHFKIHFGKKPFKCEKCHKAFTRHYNLSNHLRVHLNEEKLLKLKAPFKNLRQSGIDCSVGSSNTERFSEEIHAKLRPFGCEKCSATFTVKSALKRHLKIHFEEKSFKCMVCHKAFNERSSLIRHFIVHTTKIPVDVKISHQVLSKAEIEGSTNTENEISNMNLAENQTLETSSVKTQNPGKPLEYEKSDAACSLKSNLTSHLEVHSDKLPFECIICHEKFSQLTTLTKHVKLHTNQEPVKAEISCNVSNNHFTESEGENSIGKSPLKCTTSHDEVPVCLGFNRNSQLPEETPTQQFSCEKCHRNFTFKNSLMRHLQTHSGEKRFKCQICCRAFVRNADLTKHTGKHMNRVALKREISCKTSFNQASVKHLQIHENLYKCQLCQNKFPDMEMLSKHIVIHIKESNFICDGSFANHQNLIDLVSHLVSHSITKPLECDVITTHSLMHARNESFMYSCDICSESFTDHGMLMEHLKQHADDGPLVCKVCHKQFCYRANLISHMETVHDGEKQLDLKCKTCHKTFSEKWKLQTHEKIHNQVKPFQCKLCHKRFSQQGNLMTHTKTVHFVDKRCWECEVCHKTFSKKEGKLRHLRTHTGEKPFECDTCGNAFAAKHHLMNHLRIHTGERPYHCETCSRRFVLKAHLNAHKKTHLKISI